MKYLLSVLLASFALMPLPIPPLPALAPQVHAAASNGCKDVGTVGNVIVAICIDDDTNAVTWANSAGMLAPVP